MSDSRHERGDGTPDELVERLADKFTRLESMRSLLGAVNSRELRNVEVSDDVLDALVRGTRHESPVVRWWSVQLLDHCPDERAFAAVVPLLDDPVDRVRRNAAHAVGCRICKPASTACADSSVIEKMRSLAEHDPNGKVRDEAARALVAIDR